MKPAKVLAVLVVLLALPAGAAEPSRLLYVAAPGVRDLLTFGGAGLLVFDINHDYQFVRRIETPASRAKKPENIKGICACAATAKLYFSTLTSLSCVDLVTEETLWQQSLPEGCDRMSILPDGSLLYVPSLEKDIWNVVDGNKGNVVATIETKSGSHNTVVGLSGRNMYLAGLRSPLLSVADTRSHRVARTVGPFSAAIRPFTVDGAERRCYVCVNELLGFEIGDIATGEKIAQVKVTGFERGPVQRHGCPSHGIALAPNEREVWLCDAANRRLHIFDLTSTEPRQVASVALREEPGWVTFSLDGRHAYSSTGEVIDAGERKIIASLADEQDRPVMSEKMIEIHFDDGKPVRNGDQFGVGRAVGSP